VYVTFGCNCLSLFLHLQYKDFKKMFKCATLSRVLRMVKTELLGVYMYKVVNNNCTHDLSNSLRVINHHIQFHCSTCTVALVLPSLVQTMGHSHNCLHELVMAMLLFKLSFSQSSQQTSENMQAYNSDKISLYFVTVLCKAIVHTKGICTGK